MSATLTIESLGARRSLAVDHVIVVMIGIDDV